MCGFAQSADGADGLGDNTSCDHRAAPSAKFFWQGPDIDWQRSFQVNATADAPAGRGYLFASVIVKGEQLRVPCKPTEGDDSRLSKQRAWLVKRGWFPVTALEHALVRMMAPCDVPLRLREVIAGRMGLPQIGRASCRERV